MSTELRSVIPSVISAAAATIIASCALAAFLWNIADNLYERNKEEYVALEAKIEKNHAKIEQIHNNIEDGNNRILAKIDAIADKAQDGDNRLSDRIDNVMQQAISSKEGG